MSDQCNPPRSASDGEVDGGDPNEVGGRDGVGLAFFGIYVLLYGGFIGLVVARPQWLAIRPFGGVNVAIAYGMGLIVAAIVLALGFMVVRRGTNRGGRPPRHHP